MNLNVARHQIMLDVAVAEFQLGCMNNDEKAMEAARLKIHTVVDAVLDDVHGMAIKEFNHGS